MESSGSDLMVFFSVLLGARCDVPFSAEEDKDRVSAGTLRPPAPQASPSEAPDPPGRASHHTPVAGVLVSSVLLLLLWLWL